MRIRDYTISDTEALIALFQKTVRTINSRDYNAQQIKVWAPDRIDIEAWKKRYSESSTFVVEDHNKIVGFTNLKPNGYLDMFYVHADYQGRGVGRLLMDTLIAKAKELGLPEVYSEVSITARPFFLKYGFEIEKEQTVERGGTYFSNFLMRFYI